MRRIEHGERSLRHIGFVLELRSLTPNLGCREAPQRGIADEFLTRANRDRPEHLEAILAPSIAPADQGTPA